MRALWSEGPDGGGDNRVFVRLDGAQVQDVAVAFDAADDRGIPSAQRFRNRLGAAAKRDSEGRNRFGRSCSAAQRTSGFRDLSESDSGGAGAKLVQRRC